MKEEYEQFEKTRTMVIINVPRLSEHYPEPYIIVSYTGTIPYNINDTITVWKILLLAGVDSPPELANKGLIDIKSGYIEKS